MGATGSLRVGFVAGVTPDRWRARWDERRGPVRLDLVPVPPDTDAAAARLFDGDLDMCFVRLPVDPHALHVVRLYDEQPVVAVPADHPVALFDEIDLTDLGDEHLLPPAVDLSRAMAAVADGQGLLALPMSLARMHRRRDVVVVRLLGVPVTTVALVWRKDVDDEVRQSFVGVVRGRTPRSTRG